MLGSFLCFCSWSFFVVYCVLSELSFLSLFPLVRGFVRLVVV